MKDHKFFVFVLSLFCILGMVTPVFAEGEGSVPFELVSYEIVNIANSSKVTPVDDTVLGTGENRQKVSSENRHF